MRGQRPGADERVPDPVGGGDPFGAGPVPGGHRGDLELGQPRESGQMGVRRPAARPQDSDSDHAARLSKLCTGRYETSAAEPPGQEVMYRQVWN
ncbi:hypothetical protein GCM10027168_40290 [Streptomyces capparidis]